MTFMYGVVMDEQWREGGEWGGRRPDGGKVVVVVVVVGGGVSSCLPLLPRNHYLDCSIAIMGLVLIIVDQAFSSYWICSFPQIIPPPHLSFPFSESALHRTEYKKICSLLFCWWVPEMRLMWVDVHKIIWIFKEVHYIKPHRSRLNHPPSLHTNTHTNLFNLCSVRYSLMSSETNVTDLIFCSPCCSPCRVSQIYPKYRN